MADRSRCKRCGVILTVENCYTRKDTYNKLHAYCKKCYLEMQKERMRVVADSGKRYTAQIRIGDRTVRLFFDSVEEKRAFLQSRKIAHRCYRGNDTQASVVRVGGTAVDGDPERCDECGGRLRYDENGFLVCEDCFLVADVVPFYRGGGKRMLRGRHAWNGEDADTACVDVYYSCGYGR